MTGVQLEKIDQTFGGQPVLCGLDLSIESGAYVVLLGPSGCGKTTTLKIIAGLLTPDRGDVRIGGNRVNQVAPRNRDVAIVFQHDGLYPHLTVGDSIRFGLQGRISATELQSRVGEAARLTQIEPILDRYPSRLSGGELRRAAVAKAIARRTSVRLLDEPLSALDVTVRHALQDDIIGWHSKFPGTSIHVTHDGQEAMRMADKIGVMEAGRIVQFATPSEVFSRPRTLAVARAIGSPPINLFQARLDEGVIRVGHPGISYHADCRSEPDRDVLVGVRPEAFRVVTAQQAKHDAKSFAGLVVSGHITRMQRVQGDVHVQLAVGEHSVLAVVPYESLCDSTVLEGVVGVTATSQSVLVFDAESGNRIEVNSGG